MPELRVRIDDREVRELLGRFTEAETKKLLRKASTKAGAAIKKAIRPAIPQGPTGNLRGALKAKRIKANTAIGVVVGPMGRKASHRHLVIGGTKPHVIRARAGGMLSTPYGVFSQVQHPGATPNPWLDRVDDSAFNQGFDAAQAVIDEALR